MQTTKTLTALSLLAFSGAAQAADHELSLELGTAANHQQNWFMFNDESQQLPSWGLRAGVAVHDRLAIIGGWHHGKKGMRLGFGGDWDDDDEEAYGFASVFYGDSFTLGLKADVPVAVWFRPYATAQGLGDRGMVRLDDDLSEDDNLNQIQRSDFSFGGIGALGVDFRMPLKDGAWAIASYLELGYGYASPLDFDELGELDGLYGVVFRWGVGVRF